MVHSGCFIFEERILTGIKKKYYSLTMTIPNKLTFLRVILSPIFFIVFFIPHWTGPLSQTSGIAFNIILWVLFLLIESTDFIDGYLARKLGQVTDIGKVLDPFADVISRITYFVCFTGIGIMPIWVLIIIIYRELSITFFRLLMIRKGIAMAASRWGKLKAVTYGFSGVCGLLLVSLLRLFPDHAFTGTLTWITFGVFLASAFAAIGSFLNYFMRMNKQLME
jgi:CDP-diacylglycerol---glycerol-3-phosphate 3-phosphatidyltransferase